MQKYDITDSFNDFYQNCKKEQKLGLKIVAFPTGMGKTYGAANNAIQVAKNGDIPIFIAPRIAILKDFEETVMKYFKIAEVIRIISDTELKQVDYYYKNIKSFKNIADNIENELLIFIKNNNIKLPTNIISLEAHFSQLNERDIKSNKEQHQIFKFLKASKNIKDIYRQFDLLKNSLQQEEIRNELNSKLWKVYNGIIDIFEVSNFFYIKQYNCGLYIEPNEIYKIWGFNSFDKQIVKDFFGLTFSLCDIKNNKKNDKYIFTVTSKKSLKYIGRTFEVKQGKLTKISGTDSNKLFFNKYINTFCKLNALSPVYYIDEADEFYNEIVEDGTKTIHLNNFLFKIKTFFDYSNISSLLSFIDKIERSKTVSTFASDFKDLIFNYNNAFTADKIEDLISVFESNKTSFNPNQILNDKLLTKLNSKIESHYETSVLFKNITNKGNVLFLFLCFLDSLGITDKIEKLKNNEKQKNTLLLGDLHKTIKNSKKFFKSWHLDKNPTFTLTSKTFFEELHNVNMLLVSSSLGETIIKDEDFIELAENNKFMFGNDSLSLVEEQIKYLDNLVSVESFSDNALLEITATQNNNAALTLSFIFSFLTKVLIRTVQEISVPNEEYEEDKTLDKEMSCHTYLKKMKTAFSSLNKIDGSQFKIKDEDLLFDEEYIFSQDKNVINLFATNYDKNIKLGKPNISSYIQMSNIHIKESPEKEILNYFSTVEKNEVSDFSSNSIVYLMSATTTINSYYGNFDYEYLYKQLNLNNVSYDATYLNTQDINLVNDFKGPYVSKNITEISRFDYGIYEKHQFDLYDNFSHSIKNSSNNYNENQNKIINKIALINNLPAWDFRELIALTHQMQLYRALYSDLFNNIPINRISNFLESTRTDKVHGVGIIKKTTKDKNGTGQKYTINSFKIEPEFKYYKEKITFKFNIITKVFVTKEKSASLSALKMYNEQPVQMAILGEVDSIPNYYDKKSITFNVHEFDDSKFHLYCLSIELLKKNKFSTVIKGNIKKSFSILENEDFYKNNIQKKITIGLVFEEHLRNKIDEYIFYINDMLENKSKWTSADNVTIKHIQIKQNLESEKLIDKLEKADCDGFICITDIDYYNEEKEDYSEIVTLNDYYKIIKDYNLKQNLENKTPLITQGLIVPNIQSNEGQDNITEEDKKDNFKAKIKTSFYELCTKYIFYKNQIKLTSSFDKNDYLIISFNAPSKLCSCIKIQVNNNNIEIISKELLHINSKSGNDFKKEDALINWLVPKIEKTLEVLKEVSSYDDFIIYDLKEKNFLLCSSNQTYLLSDNYYLLRKELILKHKTGKTYERKNKKEEIIVKESTAIMSLLMPLYNVSKTMPSQIFLFEINNEQYYFVSNEMNKTLEHPQSPLVKMYFNEENKNLLDLYFSVITANVVRNGLNTKTTLFEKFSKLHMVN